MSLKKKSIGNYYQRRDFDRNNKITIDDSAQNDSTFNGVIIEEMIDDYDHTRNMF